MSGAAVCGGVNHAQRWNNQRFLVNNFQFSGERGRASRASRKIVVARHSYDMEVRVAT